MESGPSSHLVGDEVLVSILEGFGPKIVSISSWSVSPGTENGSDFGFGCLGSLPLFVGRVAGRAEDSAQRC